jgi:hypothetical protein
MRDQIGPEDDGETMRESTMAAKPKFTPRGAPPPPPAARFVRVIWCPDNRPIEVTILANQYEGYYTHWVPDGDRMRTTVCLKSHCLWCKHYGMVANQWTGYILCKDPKQEGVHALILTAAMARILDPHLSQGTRGCVFKFWRDKAEKGNPMRGQFMRRIESVEYVDEFDIFDVLCRLWRVETGLARRMLRPEEASRKPTWQEMSEQAADAS